MVVETEEKRFSITFLFEKKDRCSIDEALARVKFKDQV
jgi:hypothetical protein